MIFKYPISIISNKNSKKNRLGILTKEDVHSVFSDDQAIYYWTSNKEELKLALKELATQNVGLIVSNGGDGTHRALINILIKDFPDYHPVILPLRGGTMNMLSDNLAIPHVTYDVLNFIKSGMENYKDFEVISKPLLRVKADKQIEYGFVFMAGTVYKALKLYYKAPEGGVAVATKTLGKTMLGWVLRSPDILKITKPVSSKTLVDSKLLSFPYVVAIVSTLPRLIMSFHPFVGPKKNKRLYFMVDGEKMLKNYNLFKFFNISKKEIWDKKRVVSVANNVDIDVKDGFSIDGEMFKLDKDTRIFIKEGPEIKLLTGVKWRMLV